MVRGGNPDCGLFPEGYGWRVVLDELRLWMDPVARTGPEAMAVDEWLLETQGAPVLRVYGWLGEWGSVGYFGDLEAAKSALPGLSWVRRWTGGGTVDHRNDWTYTLVSPPGTSLSLARGSESYRMVHEALAAALNDCGVPARLSSGATETGAALCFHNPVGHDLLGADGRKLAGAGQRRTRFGWLHQGSAQPGVEVRSEALAMFLAGHLARRVQLVEIDVPAHALESKIAHRYADPRWTAGRARGLR